MVYLDQSQIPRIIWQTAKSTPHAAALPLIESWKTKNPGYHYAFMDDVACDEFIRYNFTPEFYEMYSSLPVGVMRADVWRVAVVYVFGGVYVDIDCECIVPLDEWLSVHSLVALEETPLGELANFMFAAAPRHPALLATLEWFMETYRAGDALDLDVSTPVQNFGQYGFSKNVSEYHKSRAKRKINIIADDKHRLYIKHYVASENWEDYDSWRTDEYAAIPTKPIKFVTTFSQSGYELYGKTWIETFTNNVKDNNITADIYVDFPIKVVDPRINIVNFDTTIKGHKQWVSSVTKLFKGLPYNKTMAIRFSYKAFVMMHAFSVNKGRYVVWLDGDCVYKSHQRFDVIGRLLKDKVIAVQREANGGNDHCESGFVLFDPDHADAAKFVEQLTTNYKVNNVVRMESPYDGFIIYKSLDGIDYVDLNHTYGRSGIQSDPGCTFLHPELKRRFIHNIGPTGKSNYDSWEQCKDKDNVFRLISNRTGLPVDTGLARNRLIKIRSKVNNLPYE